MTFLSRRARTKRVAEHDDRAAPSCLLPGRETGQPHAGGTPRRKKSAVIASFKPLVACHISKCCSYIADTGEIRDIVLFRNRKVPDNAANLRLRRRAEMRRFPGFDRRARTTEFHRLNMAVFAPSRSRA